jgi:hypothetical protein
MTRVRRVDLCRTSSQKRRFASDRQSAPCYSRSPFLAFLPRWTATSLKSSPQTRRLRGNSILNFNPSPEATFVPLMQVR